MISQFVSSSPASDSVLTAQSLEPASDSVSPSLSALPPPSGLPSPHSVKVKEEPKKEAGQPPWVAQLVKPPTSAQVMISWFVSWSPALGSVLTARSLEPAACFGFCFSLSLSAPLLFTFSLSLSKINKH